MKQDLPPEQMDLCTIMPEDLPVFQQPDTEAAINRLKSLVGLEHVKKQILDHTALVKLNKLRATKGMFNRNPPMHMVFTGNPGTGKTTIAKYIGEIYHSIGVLSSGHVVVTEVPVVACCLSMRLITFSWRHPTGKTMVCVLLRRC